MAARKATLKLQRNGMAINADVRVKKLDENPIFSGPEVKDIDWKTKQEVHQEEYIKEDHPNEAMRNQEIPRGTRGRRWVNEDGDVVPSERVVKAQKIDGDWQKVEKHDSTISGSKTLPVEKWIPESKLDTFVVSSTYEMWGEEPEDESQLWELAQYMEDEGEYPVVVFLHRSSVTKKWGIITPEIEEDGFSIIVHKTQKSVDPEHEMPMLDAEDIEDEEEGEFVEQEDPF